MSDGTRRDRPKTFLDAMRDNTVGDMSIPPGAVQQTTVRLLVKVEKEIQRIAEVAGVSMNVAILDAVDRLLAHHGRASIVELAPWAVGYFSTGPPEGRRLAGNRNPVARDDRDSAMSQSPFDRLT